MLSERPAEGAKQDGGGRSDRERFGQWGNREPQIPPGEAGQHRRGGGEHDPVCRAGADAKGRKGEEAHCLSRVGTHCEFVPVRDESGSELGPGLGRILDPELGADLTDLGDIAIGDVGTERLASVAKAGAKEAVRFGAVDRTDAWGRRLPLEAYGLLGSGS